MRSIGKIFLSQREKKKLSIEEVHKQIKIHPKYIKALETDNYEVFEGKVHAKGFLRIYAEYLDLNTDEIMALWRREYEMLFDKSKFEKFYKINEVHGNKFFLTPGIIVSCLLLFLVLGFFGYLYYQYRTYTGAPNLEIFKPTNNYLTESDILDINGETDLDSDLYINNQKIILNTNGGFAATVKLKEGVNNLSFVSINKLDKRTEVLRTVIYKIREDFESTQSTQSTQSTSSKNSRF